MIISRFSFQGDYKAERLVAISTTQTKSHSELLEMLLELKQMAEEVEKGEVAVVHRCFAFFPFVQAVNSNIASFFVHESLDGLSSLYVSTNQWLSGFAHNYLDFKQKLSKQAMKWMKMSRRHPSVLFFVGKQLLNVVTTWPTTQVSPSHKRVLAAQRKVQARRQRRQKLKL